MRFEGSRRGSRRLSLTALIDVVFLLLIFFMLSSRFFDFGAVGLDVEEPGGDRPAAEDVVHVDVRDDGTVGIAGATVSNDALAGAVRTWLSGRPSGSVVVLPDAGVPVERLVSVLEEVRRSGATQITLRQRSAPAES
jgi:biopolymer transport protein ExbD